MPIFFLHQVHDGKRVEDRDGSDFASLEEARREAIVAALEIMADRVKQGQDPNHSHFEIADHRGNVLFVLPFRHLMTQSGIGEQGGPTGVDGSKTS